ncbi:hypothetical protein CHUAL_011231, partial [Chamberlinius hualienensis]
ILTLDLTSSPLNFDNPYIPHIEQYCSFTTKYVYGIYWCLPLFLDVVIIYLFMFWTIWNIRQAATGTEMVNQQINMQIFIVSARIVVVLGLTWIVSFIMTLAPLFNWKIATTNVDVGFLCGILQGYFLVFVYCPKGKIMDKIRHGISRFRAFSWNKVNAICNI